MPATEPVGPVTIALSTGLVLSAMVSLAGWVSLDARARGSDRPGVWAVLTLPPLSLIGLPWYLFYGRARLGERTASPARLERLIGTWTTAALGALLLGTLVSPPDPLTQTRYIPVAFLVTLPVGYLVVYRGTYTAVIEWLENRAS